MTESTWRRLPRTSPEEAGVSREAIGKLVEQLDPLGTHSLLVLRHGAVVAERFWAPHTPERPHMMFSVSKTFTSMAVGLAVAEGLLTVEDRVVDLLPDDAPAAVGDRLAALRVRHLLTMTSGHDRDSMDFVEGIEDWPRAILATPHALDPGSRFVYDTGATYLLSAIITRLTGQRLLDYLTPRLLAPLGIVGATWEQDPRGIDTGGFGLAVTTEDMAAFGQLLLQRGRWGDVQLLPADWVDTAMSNLVDSAPQGWAVDNSIGYGYQMWQCQPGCARADGAFGQFIVVWPEHDAVIAITSGTARTQEQLDAVWACLGVAFGPSNPLAAPDGAVDLGDPLALAVPRGEDWTEVGALVEGRTYGLDQDVAFPDPLEAAPPVRTFAVRRDGDAVVLDAGPLSCRAAYGRWAETTGDELGRPLSAAYAWTDGSTLEVRVAGLGTPFVWTVRLAFAADAESVDVTIDQNVSFVATELLRATARS